MKSSEALNKRIIDYVVSVIKHTRILTKNNENQVFINQIIRSCSSIGANYSECMYAHTRAEFIHSMNISRKETNETLYWLHLIDTCNPLIHDKITPLLNEGEQLLKIFISSIKTAKDNYEK